MKEQGFNEFLSSRGAAAALQFLFSFLEEQFPDLFASTMRKFYPTKAEMAEDKALALNPPEARAFPSPIVMVDEEKHVRGGKH
jgi:hypothetical protein